MKKCIIIILIYLCSNTLASATYYSPLWREEIHTLLDSIDQVNLKEKPVMGGSVQIWSKEKLLADSLDYQVDYQEGIIQFKSKVKTIKVEYAVYPASLQQKYYNYQLIDFEQSDSLLLVTRAISQEEYKPLDLVVKGNKTITVSVADGEDFQINQNLFLRISGKLSEEVNIQAQVSDSESPITPEGDSRQLSNLDQIFIRIYGKKYELGFGDLEHRFSQSHYLDFTAVFEGVKVRWGDESRITGAAALSKAENTSIEFNGIDGKQGPYWLSNEYGGESLLISGSEKVFLNGIEMQRGDDYTIDYAEGSLTFTSEHFISSSDRIYVVYQYSDEEYRQNVYLQDGEWKLSDNVTIGSAMYRVEDDFDNPLSTDYSVGDQDSLSKAGDTAAIGSGVYHTEIGAGEYILTEGGYYQYVGIDGEGDFNISFLSDNKGDYEISADGLYYEYVGEGLGSYMPGVRLSSPESKSNYVVYGIWKTGEVKLTTEGLLADYDKNTASDIDDEDNISWISRSQFDYKHADGIAQPEMKLSWQQQSKNLFSFDPVTTAEENFETILLPDSLAKTQYRAETGVLLWDTWYPGFTISEYNAGEDISQEYVSTGATGKQKGLLPEFSYRYYRWKNQLREIKEDKYNHTAEMFYQIYNFGIGYKLVREEQELVTGSREQDRDYVYLRYESSIWEDELYYEELKTDSLASNFVRRQKTYGIRGKLKKGRQMLDYDLAHREISDSLQTDYDLVKLNYNGMIKNTLSLNGYYQIRNLDYYPKVRELVYIGQGEGSFDEDGEEDNDGDYDWQVTSIDYDSSQQSVELSASGRIQLTPPARWGNFWQKLKLEVETTVNEQSTTENILDLYLLSSDELLDKKTTIYGQQTNNYQIWYDILPQKLRLRLSNRNEERLDSRYQDSETTETSVSQGYLNWKYRRKLGFRAYLEREAAFDSRYDSESNGYNFAWETIYSPARLNYQIKLEYGWEEGNNASSQYQYSLDKYEINQNLSWFMNNTSRWYGKLKFRHNNREGDDYTSWQEEKRDGNVLIWNVSYNYKFNEYVKISLEYDGDKYPQEKSSHQVKLEAAAEF